MVLYGTMSIFRQDFYDNTPYDKSKASMHTSMVATDEA